MSATRGRTRTSGVITRTVVIGASGGDGRRGRPGNDLVDEAVFLRLVGREPTVTVRVRFDPLDGLPGVEGDPLGHHALEVDDLFGLDGNVSRLALHLP